MEIVLGRVGHYFDAGNGSCSTSIVTDTFGTDEAVSSAVNVAGWHHGGESFRRSSVPVVTAPSTDDTASSFHLTRDCPWGR